MTNRLGFIGYEDPVKALADFISNFYDLLLVDVNMPSMNGFYRFQTKHGLVSVTGGVRSLIF